MEISKYFLLGFILLLALIGSNNTAYFLTALLSRKSKVLLWLCATLAQHNMPPVLDLLCHLLW